jgi:hypothetical protein
MKILPAGAKLFHMDVQTGMTKLTVECRNFSNAPKNISESASTHHAKITFNQKQSLLVLKKHTCDLYCSYFLEFKTTEK